MILYHGSPAIVSVPDVFHSRSRVDFGKGFYTTPLREQAINWCQRFMRKGQAYLNTYELADEAFNRFSVLRFDSYSEEWLDFVFSCRQDRDQSSYDIVLGGVANDRVFDTVELYLEGLIGKQEALGRLRYEQPNSQLCIRSQLVIEECLRYVGSEQQ